jgi:glutamine cyclotransferase
MLDNSRILESSGLYGESSIQIINLDKYQTELKRQLPPTEFGEGCINYKNKEGKLEI